MRALYRVRQFWHALVATPESEELAQARHFLTPALMELFLRLQPSEQAHSLWVYRQLREAGETNPDLLAAALLHDVGKSCHPLQLWERAAIVLGKALFPQKSRNWGQAEPQGWKRPFVVAAQHSVWGAEMAARAGASPMTVALIQRHQDAAQRSSTGGSATESIHSGQASLNPISPEEQLLSRLQLLDDES